jgi:hypothetical protein
MKKYLIPALFSLLAILGRNNVAAASEKKSFLDDMATVGVTAGAIGTALAVKVPVQTCKTIGKSIGDVNEKVHRDLDLDDSPVSVAVAAVPALPVGTTYGLVTGPVKGTQDALVTYRDFIDYTFWEHVGFNVR